MAKTNRDEPAWAKDQDIGVIPDCLFAERHKLPLSAVTGFRRSLGKPPAGPFLVVKEQPLSSNATYIMPHRRNQVIADLGLLTDQEVGHRHGQNPRAVTALRLAMGIPHYHPSVETRVNHVAWMLGYIHDEDIAWAAHIKLEDVADQRRSMAVGPVAEVVAQSPEEIPAVLSLLMSVGGEVRDGNFRIDPAKFAALREALRENIVQVMRGAAQEPPLDVAKVTAQDLAYQIDLPLVVVEAFLRDHSVDEEPDADVRAGLGEALATPAPAERTLDNRLRIRFEDRHFEIAGEKVHPGQKVLVFLAPSTKDGIRVLDDDGRELAATALSIDEAGFQANGHAWDDPAHPGTYTPAKPSPAPATELVTRATVLDHKAALAKFSDGRRFDLDMIEREILGRSEQILLHAFEIGRLLLWAKAELPHGKFEEWATNRLPFSQPTRSRYMQIAKWLLEHPQFLEPLARSGLRHVLEFTTLPDEQLQDMLQENMVGEVPLERISTLSYRELKDQLEAQRRQIEAQKAELDSERKDADRLRGEVRVARDKVAELVGAMKPQEVEEVRTQTDEVFQALREDLFKFSALIRGVGRRAKELPPEVRAELVGFIEFTSTFVEHERAVFGDLSGTMAGADYFDLLERKRPLMSEGAKYEFPPHLVVPTFDEADKT